MFQATKSWRFGRDGLIRFNLLMPTALIRQETFGGGSASLNPVNCLRISWLTSSGCPGRKEVECGGKGWTTFAVSSLLSPFCVLTSKNREYYYFNENIGLHPVLLCWRLQSKETNS